MFAEQIHAGRNFWRLLVVVPQPKFPREHHKMHLNLDTSEYFTNTIPRAGAKWAQGQFVTSYRFVLRHSIRIEVIRCLPELRVALNQVGRDVNFGSCGHKKVTKVIVVDCLASHKPKWRI